MFKKTISLFIVSMLILNQSLFALMVNGTDLSVGSEPLIECQMESTSEYYPIGDTSGKSIFTKRDITEDCNITKVVNGRCLEWDEEKQNFSQEPETYDSYETLNYEDSMGTLLSAIGSFDQIEHMWSGWHGYCEIGTKSDFSWTEDPMFWASLAMSFALGMAAGSGSEDAATKKVAETGSSTLVEATTDKATKAAADSFIDQVTNSIVDLIDETSEFFTEMVDSATESASKAVEYVANNSVEDMTSDLIDATFSAAYDAAMKDITENMGMCLAAAAFDYMSTAYSFYNYDPNGDGNCDPIDEICGSGEEVTQESDIMTMDQMEFQNMVDDFATDPDGYDIMDQIVVIDDGTSDGVVSFRIRKTQEMAGSDQMDTSEMDNLKDDLRVTKALIGATMTTASMAGCLSGHSSANVSVANPTDNERADLRSGISSVISFIGSKIPTPYGPIIALVGKLILYVATSYDKIDSCHNEGDAKEIGSRHEKTQKALKYDLCHAVSRECAETSILVGEGGFLNNSCSLDGLNYCCYDQLLTKVLVEQIKAQLGRDYSHCTGITLHDLNYISLQQCSDAVMAANPDGSKFYYDVEKDVPPDVTTAFQFVGKCVDMTDFLEYLQDVIGDDVDMDDFTDFWDDLTDREPI